MARPRGGRDGAGPAGSSSGDPETLPVLKYSSLVLSFGLLILSCAMSVAGSEQVHFTSLPAAAAVR